MSFAQYAERSLHTDDGRTVAWTEWGDPDAVPVLRVPGVPGSRWNVRTDTSTWRERGLRMLTTERPGFGRSTRLPGRGFAEHADDLAQVLDAAQVDRAFVYGASGAAPHILAFAARHPDRVRAATVLSGAAPMTDAQAQTVIALNAQARRLVLADDRDGVVALLAPVRTSILADPLSGFSALMTTAPAQDLATMADADWQAGYIRAVTEALTAGVEGWADETMALCRPWTDIELADVRSSVTWWHSADDRNAPIDAARALVEQLPDAQLNVWPDAGHFAAYRREGEVLDELLSRG